MRELILVSVVGLVLGVLGCASAPPKLESRFSWVRPATDAVEVRPAPGSLYAGDGAGFAGLYYDTRALRPGDLVTIVIEEQVSASKSAETDLEEESGRDTELSALAGALQRLATLYPQLDLGRLLGYQNTSRFRGSGKTSRSGEMLGTLTAVVVGRLPGGALEIFGEKRIRVNEEEQILRIRGAIRPRDVDADNRVSSRNVALAQIEYTGSGLVAQQQSPGWFHRLLDWIWPF